jgi:replicative DNA helicase
MENRSIQIEQELLGSIISSFSSVMEVKDILKPYHMVGTGHSAILDAIYSLHEASTTITPIAVDSKLPKDLLVHGKTYDYLIQCMSAGVAVLSARDYADMIIDQFVRSQIVESCQQTMMNVINNPYESGVEIAAKCASTMRDFINSNGKKQFISDRSLTLEIINNIGKEIPRYSTGLKLLDESMDGGLYEGRVYGFFARMKMGKTILAGTIAHNLMMNGTKTLFIAAEMSSRQIHERILARMMDCYTSDFRNKKSLESQWFQQKLSAACMKLDGYLQYADAAGLTFQRLKDIAAEAVERSNAKVIILDYWQLVQHHDSKTSKADHLSKVAQWIAEHSKDTGTAWIVIGQLNREGKVKDSDGAGAAFDQIYNIMGDPENREDASRWLEMVETRYTKWQNVGSDERPAFFINDKGLFFNEQ